MIIDGINELKLPEDKSAEQAPDEKEHQTLTTEEIDSLLDKCLLQALYTSIKEKDLPMPGSTLWYIFLLQFHILMNTPSAYFFLCLFCYYSQFYNLYPSSCPMIKLGYIFHQDIFKAFDRCKHVLLHDR